MGAIEKLRESQAAQRGLVKVIIDGEVFFIEDTLAKSKGTNTEDKYEVNKEVKGEK